VCDDFPGTIRPSRLYKTQFCGGIINSASGSTKKLAKNWKAVNLRVAVRIGRGICCQLTHKISAVDAGAEFYSNVLKTGRVYIRTKCLPRNTHIPIRLFKTIM